MTSKQFSYINNLRAIFLTRFHFSSESSTWFACLFALESSFGTSRLAISLNNHCSMKVPRVRVSVCQNFCDNTGEIWASYSNLSDCVLDFVLWLQYQKPKRWELGNLETLYSYFRSYCPEKDYIDKINNIYSNFKNYNYE